MFNSERTIAGTLASICGESHRALDIVVIDDGSTDGSAAVAAAWRARDSRVRLVCQANAGVAAARNKGAALTGAGFLAFVDADDLWAPTKIEYQLKALQADGPSVGLVYCWYASIDGQDNVRTFGPPPLAEAWVLQRLCAPHLIGNGPPPLGARLR